MPASKAKSTAEERIDHLMEQATDALTGTRYFECERLALEAMTLAHSARDFDRMARIVMPLQESRRLRRQLASDVKKLNKLNAYDQLEKLLHGGAVLLAVILAALLLGGGGNVAFAIFTLVALTMGVLMVLPIGGADMPVVISLLNSCTGLAAAATGFVLHNDALLISGTIVGASGTLLTRLMCKAMNRPLSNVLFGAFGAAQATGAGATAGAGA